MSTNELLRNLQDQGVELWVEDGRLRYRGPQHVIEPALADMKANKAELLTALLTAEGVSEELAANEASAIEDLSEEEEERYATACDLIEELRGCAVTFGFEDGELRYDPADRVSEFGRSELRRCEAEVVEILREESERQAAWDARLASQPETDIMPDDEYEEYKKLTPDQKDVVVGWVEENLQAAPEMTKRYRRDSYQLKHDFARSPEGFYVSDAQFRTGMWIAGYPGRRYPGKRYEELESRYYYLQPNYAGLIRKLEAAGVPSGWALDAIIEAHPDPDPDPELIVQEHVHNTLMRCVVEAKGPVSVFAWQDDTTSRHPSITVAEFSGAVDRLIEKGMVERDDLLYRPAGLILSEDQG